MSALCQKRTHAVQQSDHYMIIHSADLTTTEMKVIEEHSDGYHHRAEFWVGFNDQNDCNCRNRWSNSVAGEAWYRGMEAAMRVRLGRKPVHDEYNRGLKQIASFRRVAEELRGNRAKIVGLLKERAWHLAARRVRPGNA